MDHVEISEEKIEVGRVTNLVSSPVCGATSVFIGKRLKLPSECMFHIEVVCMFLTCTPVWGLVNQ